MNIINNFVFFYKHYDFSGLVLLPNDRFKLQNVYI